MIKELFRFITPRYAIDRYHLVLAWFANWWFGYPSHSLFVIGVTGTDGKTTTASLITQLLAGSGKRVALFSTVLFRIGGKEQTNETKMTTMSAWQLQKMLRAVTQAGDQYVVIETSSHALEQHRVHGIAYDIAVMTNTSHEHLDYHKTMDAYRAAKERLFSGLQTSFQKKGIPKAMVLNMDDETFEGFAQHDADVKVGYILTRNKEQETRNKEKVDLVVLAEHITIEQWSSTFTLHIGGGSGEVHFPFPGVWNIENALAAVSVASLVHLDRFTIQKLLASAHAVPGRMEKIDEGQPFDVIIDYAVTPNAFQHLYTFIDHVKKERGEGRILAVFGATGERDREKRPMLGAIAARYADMVFITNEDPWREDPHAIMEAVATGARSGGKEEGKNLWKIFDRREAIRTAFVQAQKGDIVVITGKGAETAMAIGKKKIPWDERAIVRELLREKVGK